MSIHTTPTTYRIGDWAAVNNGQPHVDANGCWWSVTLEQGWSGRPSVHSEQDPRSNADGLYGAPSYADGRTIDLGGTIRAPNQIALQQAMDQVPALLAGGPVTLEVIEAHLTRTAEVEQAPGQQVAVAKWSPFVATWQLHLLARDPLRYGPQQGAGPTGLPVAGGGIVWPLFSPSGYLSFGEAGESGQITLTNPGTAAAWPTFTVAGAVLGGTVLTDTGSGRRIVWAGDVPSSATLLVVDSAYGTAELNGADRSGLLVVKEWFPVPAGGSLTVQFSTLGAAGQSGHVIASWKPTYL